MNISNFGDLNLERRAERLLMKIASPISEEIFGFQGYTGIDRPLGCHELYNTRLASYQLVFTLAMSQHPLINEIISSDGINFETFNAKPLVEASVLSGMKVLDIGCGAKPTFARCVRYLGADVYTFDKISSESFIWKGNFSWKYLSLEVRNHLQLDIQEDDAVKKVIELCGENFDFVTKGFVVDRDLKNEDRIVFQLLKPKGIYFDADGYFKLISKPFQCYLVRTSNGLVGTRSEKPVDTLNFN